MQKTEFELRVMKLKRKINKFGFQGQYRPTKKLIALRAALDVAERELKAAQTPRPKKRGKKAV